MAAAVAFVAVMAPATESHASGFSYAFAMPPQVGTPGAYSSALAATASVDGTLTIDVAATDGTTITATGDPRCALVATGEHCVIAATADAAISLPFSGAYTGMVVDLTTTATDAAGPVTFAPATAYPAPPVDVLTLPTGPSPTAGALPPPAVAPITEAAASQTATLLAHRRTRVVALTNQFRTGARIKTLTISPNLTRSAQAYAQHLAADGAFSHTDGSALTTRVLEAGYTYQVVGENLALGQTSAKSVVTAWMASPEHRANMLDTRYTQMGVGVARRHDGQLVWCIDFGVLRK